VAPAAARWPVAGVAATDREAEGPIERQHGIHVSHHEVHLPIRGGDAGDWPPGSGGRHAEVEAGDGPTVEFDNRVTPSSAIPRATTWG